MFGRYTLNSHLGIPSQFRRAIKTTRRIFRTLKGAGFWLVNMNGSTNHPAPNKKTRPHFRPYKLEHAHDGLTAWLAHRCAQAAQQRGGGEVGLDKWNVCYRLLLAQGRILMFTYVALLCCPRFDEPKCRSCPRAFAAAVRLSDGIECQASCGDREFLGFGMPASSLRLSCGWVQWCWVSIPEHFSRD